MYKWIIRGMLKAVIVARGRSSDSYYLPNLFPQGGGATIKER
jgi:hypothetical protein